jgi:hypothetical protein
MWFKWMLHVLNFDEKVLNNIEFYPWKAYFDMFQSDVLMMNDKCSWRLSEKGARGWD